MRSLPRCEDDLKNAHHTLTTVLLITVVSTVVVAIANGPERDATVVGLAVKLCVVVTSICWSHCGQKKQIGGLDTHTHTLVRFKKTAMHSVRLTALL